MQGFSLVEAIAVICLVSILASGSVLFLADRFPRLETGRVFEISWSSGYCIPFQKLDSKLYLHDYKYPITRPKNLHLINSAVSNAGTLGFNF